MMSMLEALGADQKKFQDALPRLHGEKKGPERTEWNKLRFIVARSGELPLKLLRAIKHV